MSRLDASLRVTAALLGTLPAAVLAAICLTRYLPLDPESGLVVGLLLALPLWVAGMCLCSLARSGRRAWLWCVGLALLLGGLTLAF